jgi:hypothetical protein
MSTLPLITTTVPTPDYTNEQLLHLHSDYRLRHEVDEALEQIGDKSLAQRSPVQGDDGRDAADPEGDP